MRTPLPLELELLQPQERAPEVPINANYQIINNYLSTLGGGGGGNSVTTQVTVNTPATTTAWADTGITINENDAVVVAATGLISSAGGETPYGPDKRGPIAHLVMCVVASGVTPSGIVSGESDYRDERVISGKAGRVWVRVSDVAEFYYDNAGSFDVTLTHTTNALTIAKIAGLSNELNALRARITALETP